MTETYWALFGVIIGSVLTGAFGLFQQNRTFSHEKEMFSLKHKSDEMVRQILKEMLNHREHVERSFEALQKAVGGYSEDQIRQFLHEVGARRTTRDDGTEWWYLADRLEERIAKLKARKSDS